MTITSKINSAILSSTNSYEVEEGEYEVGKAVVHIDKKEEFTLDFSCSKFNNDGCFLEIKNSKNVVIENLKLNSKNKNDFAIKITASSVVIKNCEISSDTACLSINASEVKIENCDFTSQKDGNGICVYQEGVVSIKTSNFTFLKGEAITVVDNGYGMVNVNECAFKKCFAGIRSSGKNQVRITNNYFMTASCAIGIYPSLMKKERVGADKILILNNLFDEIPNTGKTVVEVEGDQEGEYLHGEIVVQDNIFLPQTKCAINAYGVKKLVFKDNDVRGNEQSTVENSIINGIKA